MRTDLPTAGTAGRTRGCLWAALLIASTGLHACAPSDPDSPAPAEAAAGDGPSTASREDGGLLPAGAPRFRTFTVADGLVSNEVNVLLQDRRGFLWIGTFGGLSRFDGVSFTTFLNDPADSTSLGHNSVNSLFEDRDGILWVGTDGGLDRFDPESETFTHLRHDPANAASIGAPVVRVVLGDANGTIWAGTRGGGLNRIDPATAAVARVRPDSRGAHASPSTVHVLAANDDGSLWVGSDAGLSHFDPETETFTHVGRDPADQRSPLLPVVTAVCRDRAGRIWAGTRTDGLYRFDPEAGRVVHYPSRPDRPGAIGNPWVLALIEDRSGTLWAGTNGEGLHRYDPASDSFSRFTFDPSDAQSLRDNNVLALLETRAGVLWVGTYGGLARRYPLSRVVAHEGVQPGDETSLSSNDVTAFAEDGAGVLYVGTNGGAMNRRVPETGAFSHLRIDPDAPGTLGSDRVFDVAVTADGVVWASTYAGLYRLEPAAGRFELFTPAASTDTSSVGIVFPLVVSNGRLWAGGDGVFEIDTETGRTVQYNVSAPETSIRVRNMLRDTDGMMWLGTHDGLMRLDPTTGVVARLQLNPQAERLSIPVEITGLVQDKSGALWVGTGDGLYRLRVDRARAAITRFHRADGLPNTDITGVTVDRRGRLWVLTVAGLAVRDPRTGRFVPYGVQDGLAGGQKLYLSPHSGILYVGTPRGYDAFDPARIDAEPPPPAPTLTGLSIDGESARIGAEGSPLTRALAMTDRLRLRYEDRVVTFTFASLDFSAPAAQQYAVRLDGFDGDWREIEGQREATFTNLSPGRYTFRVRAAGRDGVWGNETALGVTVVPPWWRAWWAYLGYVALLVGGVSLVYRNRQNHLRLQYRMEMEQLEAEKLRELDHSRSRFFANVSHEFRTPLTLTLGPLEDILAGVHGPLDAPMAAQVDLARRSAGRVLDLINQILDVARLESGRIPLRARPLDLGPFVATVAQPFQALADRKAMTFEVAVPAAPVGVYADPPHLEKAVANLLSNALKFTPEGGTVRVTVAAEGAAARVAVRDSGPGILAADLPYVFDRFYQVNEARQTQLGTGIGLALAKEVVDLHGGTLEVASEEGFGSTFTITLPLGHAHLAPDQIDETAPPWVPGAPSSPPFAEPGGDGSTTLATASGDDSVDEAPDADVTTVLVVEDHAEVRAYVRRHLEGGSPAYRVIEAADGEEGLAKARALLPDLVLSDVLIPSLDGLAPSPPLRANPETDFIPVILLTAKAAPEDKLEGLGELCDDYLTKPFDVAELRARIANLIAVRTRLRERFRQEATARAPGTEAAAPVAVTSADDAFLERVREAVAAHIGDETFSVERLAEAVSVSRGHLHRQLRALTRQTPSDLIRTMRLARAEQLLAGRAGNVSEIAYAVGFKSVAHFSDRFVDAYGCRPSGYANRHGATEDAAA